MFPSNSFTVVVDRSEPEPLMFGSIKTRSREGGETTLFVPTVRRALPARGYSIDGFEDRIVIAHRSLERLFFDCGTGRAAFEDVLERLASIPSSHLVCAFGLGEIFSAPAESRISRKSVFASVTAWQARYRLAVWYAGRHHAEVQVFEILRRFYEDRQRREAGEVLGPGSAVLRDYEKQVRQHEHRCREAAQAQPVIPASVIRASAIGV
jgi:hypothetical protein